jgi:hypothetical protein
MSKKELKEEKLQVKKLQHELNELEAIKKTIENFADKLKEEPKVNPNAISIEGAINWKLIVDTETKNTQVLYNASVSNEGAVLALCQQIINSIITHEENNGAKSKDTQRMRIAQFELQKLFGRCLTYILDNRDKELAPKDSIE